VVAARVKIIGKAFARFFYHAWEFGEGILCDNIVTRKAAVLVTKRK